jgi:hypothetical protein
MRDEMRCFVLKAKLDFQASGARVDILTYHLSFITYSLGEEGSVM